MISIRKNGREQIRVERQDFRGHDLINVRVWYADESGEYRPGKQGIAFKSELLPDVLDALSAINEVQEAA